MSDINSKPIKVEITGGSVVTNTLVFGLVQKTLLNHGFSNLEAVHSEGDTQPNPASVSSMLDLCEATYPSVFWVPISVKQNLSRALQADESAPKEMAMETLTKTVVYGQALRPEEDAQ